MFVYVCCCYLSCVMMMIITRELVLSLISDDIEWVCVARETARNACCRDLTARDLSKTSCKGNFQKAKIF